MLSNSLRPHILCGGDGPQQTGGESTDAMLAAYTKGLPGLMQVTNEQILPNELAQLASAQATSPQLAALQAQIYGTSGRELNRIGNSIADENAMSAAQRDANIMSGPGAALIEAANQAQRKIDPEYYKLREQSAAGISQMFNPMTGGETESITRSLNRQNVNNGNFNVPSMTNVVGNAQTFGNASRDRLGQAIGMATGAMPGMRSGVDVFQQATGKPSFANTGNQVFQGVQQGQGQQAMGMANGFLGQAGENQRLSQNLNANRRDSLDRVNETMSAQPISC